MVRSYNPSSLEEALSIKAEDRAAVIYAGGTDLMVAKTKPSSLLFINQLSELHKVNETKDFVEIGAALTYRELLAEDRVPKILKQAIKEIAAPSLRNTGTIGGNICNASPAGDTLPILYLLDAVLVLAAKRNEEVERREVLIKDFILGIRKTALLQDELLEKIIIRKDSWQDGAIFGFKKVGARKAQAISKLVFAAVLKQENGFITRFAVAFGSVGITVVRRTDIEKQYIGLPLADFKAAVPAIVASYEEILKPIDDQRSTAEYRKKVCLNLLKDFLTTCYSRVVIKNGLLADGTGEDAYLADLLIEADRIKKIAAAGSFEGNEYADASVIEARGLIVSPGFIDTHSHSDLKVLIQPELFAKLQQGITTEVLGQDGISMAPLPLDCISAWKKNLAGLDGEAEHISWRYKTTANYLAMIEEAAPALNESYLVPHGNIRMEAMGQEDREPTPEEMHEMCRITRREMEAGCLGLSTGLIYIPCAYAKTDELIELCRVVAEYDGVFVVHQRSEADTILASMEEILEIGRKSGVKIHFSHFKVCGRNNWKYLPDMFTLLDKAKAEGIRVTFDQYPYLAGSTMLGVILPPWAHDGGTNRLMERLQNTDAREKMKQDIREGIPGWDNFVEFAGTDKIFITSVKTEKNKEVIGLSLDELGKKRNIEALDAALDLLLEEENAVGMVDFYGLEEHIIQIMQREEMNVCTDGLLSGKPHPRVYGSFPRILGKYVREEKIFRLEAAVEKMTGKAAAAMGIKERGLLRENFFADIVVWDAETIKDKGTFEDPAQRPEGIRYVLVNGVIVIDNSEYMGNRCGRVIRRR